MGRTHGLVEDVPAFLDLVEDDTMHPDGAYAPSGHVWGTYLHGIFVASGFRRAWLDNLRSLYDLPSGPSESAAETQQDPFDRLADHLEHHLRLEELWSLLGL